MMGSFAFFSKTMGSYFKGPHTNEASDHLGYEIFDHRTKFLAFWKKGIKETNCRHSFMNGHKIFNLQNVCKRVQVCPNKVRYCSQ